MADCQQKDFMIMIVAFKKTSYNKFISYAFWVMFWWIRNDLKDTRDTDSEHTMITKFHDIKELHIPRNPQDTKGTRVTFAVAQHSMQHLNTPAITTTK